MIGTSWAENALEKFFAICGFTQPLTKEDQERWAAARTLTDLGELTAQWLEGTIDSHPAYGKAKIDGDDAPSIASALIRLNQAGYVTYDSQDGYDGPGHDGAYWTQLAAVTGFATPNTYRWLRDALTGTRFATLMWPCKARPWHRGQGIAVTTRDGFVQSRFGTRLGYTTIADELYHGVSDEALEALRAAWQVTVYDPTPGSNDLWKVLAEAAEQRRAGGVS